MKKKENKIEENKEIFQVANSLGDLTDMFSGMNVANIQTGGMSSTSSINTMVYDTNYDLITQLRSALEYAYVKHGIIKNFIDIPVDDAFSKGVHVKTKKLNADQLKTLHAYLERNSVLATIAQSLKWGRLFGGGGIIIETNQNPVTPLNENAIKEGSPLNFIAASMWELNDSNLNYSNAILKVDVEVPYNYYGQRLHKTRVLRIVGKEAPPLIRPRLRGFGLSELEGLIRSFNSYLKCQDVIFKLLDEAKIDVYGIKGFNVSLATDKGTEAIYKRMVIGNALKNYQSGIAMDTEDNYQQKQVAFSGIAEILKQIMIMIAGSVRFPVTKLFGLSSAGFNSGDDDIENYNAMVESEIRAKSKYLIIEVLDLCCRHLFGFAPDDLTIEWESLRILKHNEEQDVKTKEFDRIMELKDRGLISDDQVIEAINYKNLLPIPINTPKIEDKNTNLNTLNNSLNKFKSNINSIIIKYMLYLKRYIKRLRIF